MSDKEKELDHIRLKYKNTITQTINRIFPETENIENIENLFGPYSYLSITWRIEHYLDDKTLTKLNTTNYGIRYKGCAEAKYSINKWF